MKPTKLLWKQIAVVAGFLCLAFCVLAVWNKHDFCRGWADHHAARAKELRADAQNRHLTAAEKRERLITAEWHDVIDHKYALVARQPWRSYPQFPLVTPNEQRIAAEKF